jgi:hypothetical protein
MATNVRMLRGNVTVLAAYPEAFASAAAPTAAELNDQFVYSTGEDNMVFNISCAIPDDGLTAHITDSDTDDTRTLCDLGQVKNPTFTTYEVSLDALRDSSVTDNGIFNLFFDLFKSPDRPFWIIVRIGKSNTAPFLTDGSDVITLFGVNTDNPNDIVEDGGLIKFGARFKNNGATYINYRVVS